MEYRILVVDEDPQVRQRHAEVLIAEPPPVGASFKIITLTSVAAALLQASRQRFHLVIASLRLSGSALELGSKLRDVDHDVRLIFVYDRNATTAQRDQVARMDGSLVPSDNPKAVRTTALELLRLQPVAAPPSAAKSTDDPSLRRSGATLADVQLALDVLRRQAHAQLALYTDSMGNIVAQRGDDKDLDVPSLSSLVAGSFVNARELGNTLRDTNTVHLSVHEGIHFDLYSANVGIERLLALVFDKQVTEPRLGMVWLLMKRAVAELVRMRAASPHADSELPANLGAELSESLNDEFDRLFGGELIGGAHR